MKLLFNDKSSISIKTRDCLAWSEVHKIYKHLQHVDFPFKEWSLQDMRGVLVYGTIDNIELLNYNLMNNISPVRISL